MARGEKEVLYRKVAKKVLSETLGVKKGETVTVETWNNGLPYARLVVAEARALGAATLMVLEDDRAFLEGIERSPKETLGLMGRQEYKMLEGTDAYVFIPGPLIGPYSKRVGERDRGNATRYNSSWYEAAKKAKLRGARMAFGYVGRDMAAVLGKEVDEVVEAQLRACLADGKALARSASKLTPQMGEGTRASLDSGGSSLNWKWKGEMEVEDGIVSGKDVAAGENMTYMPGGLVIKGVAPGSANGTVYAEKSNTWSGMVEDATLTFAKGKLVKWDSRRSKELVDRLVGAVPKEKRRLAWAQVGLNPLMRRGFGQDRFSSGTIALSGFGFTALVRKGTLSSAGKSIVKQGNL